MDWLQAVILGVIEGITEFLPVSSTGHLTIASQLMGLQVDDPGVTAFTAIIQIGAIFASIVYFWSDIARLATAWFAGLRDPERRDVDYRMGWSVIVGSIPIGIVGLVGRPLITGPLRSVWWVAVALIAWSAVIWFAEKYGSRSRGEETVTMRDTLFIGLWQCFALIPGVSRSGATISAGLMRGLDRVAATRLSFFLAIPALTAAGALEAVQESDAIASSVGWGMTLLATGVSFIVGYLSIAWLLRLVAGHSLIVFIPYRVALGLAIVALLVTGVVVP
ncbi:MAG: undecaprenyl-diphosphate phosphatase [Candidatus Nanopelagicales bacterium]